VVTECRLSVAVICVRLALAGDHRPGSSLIASVAIAAGYFLPFGRRSVGHALGVPS
jgi:hypothetical protein